MEAGQMPSTVQKCDNFAKGFLRFHTFLFTQKDIATTNHAERSIKGTVVQFLNINYSSLKN